MKFNRQQAWLWSIARDKHTSDVVAMEAENKVRQYARRSFALGCFLGSLAAIVGALLWP